jgi:hypothetical protein
VCSHFVRDFRCTDYTVTKKVVGVFVRFHYALHLWIGGFIRTLNVRLGEYSAPDLYQGRAVSAK